MACCGPKDENPLETFHPDYHNEPITEKFYSRYERLPEGTTPLIQKYEAELERQKKHDARCSYKLPIYTNQTYGWLPGYAIRFLQSCERNTHTPGMMDEVKEIATKHMKGTLPTYHDCVCGAYLQNKPCRYLKREKKN